MKLNVNFLLDLVFFFFFYRLEYTYSTLLHNQSNMIYNIIEFETSADKQSLSVLRTRICFNLYCLSSFLYFQILCVVFTSLSVSSDVIQCIAPQCVCVYVLQL